MLATRLSSALANKSVVIASLVAAGALAALAIGVSLALANKSGIAELQEKEIEQYLAAIEMQRQQVEAKTAELEQLNLVIAAKSQEVETLGSGLAGQSEEMEELQLQVGKLRTEIGLLQSKIRSDEQYISDLTRQLQETQKEIKIIRISHYGLAVANDVAVVFPIEVDIVNAGSGSISVDVSNTQYETDFQGAVRTAAAAASQATGVMLSDKNIVVRIIGNDESDQGKIDGSSAGAVIAGMIAAGLTDSKVNEKVLVTGTIEQDGRVGTVANMELKAKAAADFGANILLVPESQDFTSTRMIVVGVSDIDDVMKYFIAK